MNSQSPLSLKRLALVCAAIVMLVASSAKAQELSPDKHFSHAFHVEEAEIDCLTCHGSVESSKFSQDVNLPTKDVCENCHESVLDLPAYGLRGSLSVSRSVPVAPSKQIEFNHLFHLSRKISCNVCHGSGAADISETSRLIPTMATCLECHNGRVADNRCALCHQNKVTLADIHPGDWRHQHGSRAVAEREWCASCHQSESSCVACHRGDNPGLNIHPGNYQFTHGLDAKSKLMDCSQCHDNKLFCNACHDANNRIPLNHSTATWRIEHGRAARADIENCASCHEESDPTCGRGGCHNDLDGVRGTNPPIHSLGGMLSAHGPWHSDNSYFCFQCHTNTQQPGTGFCGYCHDSD